MKKLYVSLISAFLASSCTLFQDGDGQVIYHWERENTGVQKFARDHSECMRQAEDFKLLPDVRTWFFSEEVKMNIRADWHSEKGIWASYVPYPGAMPVMVNSLRNDSDSSPPVHGRPRLLAPYLQPAERDQHIRLPAAERAARRPD